MQLRVFNRRKHLQIEVKRVGFFTQFIGLMFSRRKTPIRFFSYSSDRKVPIHSWFVFYDFLIVWMDSENKIVSWKVVKPFTSLVLPTIDCRAFIEIPIDGKYRKELEFVVGKRQRFKYN